MTPRAAWCIGTVAVSVLAGAASPAHAQTCLTPFGSHSPCVVTGSAPDTGMTSETLSVTFANVGPTSWSWFLYASDDPSCPTSPPGPPWATFSPFLGFVPAGATVNSSITVTMDGGPLTPGAHHAYACLQVADFEVVAISLELTVHAMCPAWFGSHTCVVEGSAAAGGSTAAPMLLQFFNMTGAHWHWVLFSSEDPSCAAPTPGHWASFSPFMGLAPTDRVQTSEVSVTMDATGLTRGVHAGYACVLVDEAFPTVAVPLTLAVDDLIFADDFESGTLEAWSPASTTDGGDLSVSAAASLGGSAAGLEGLVDDTVGLYVQDDTPADESRYRARFYLDPNGFDPGEAEGHRRTRTLLVFSEAPTRRVAALVLRRLGGVYAVMGRARLDDNSQADTGFFAVTDEPHALEIDLVAASGPDTLDGTFELWIDGVSRIKLTGLDNSLAQADFVRMGALSVKSGAAGTLFWDEFESRRYTYIGLLP